ncbi:hypothetical protein L1987_51537 [Smallanthus sonchifolius]|uniref:Uncharacterized protein n=1 Tax=Smallanthus sonchifolius TaxID=185202 RepID=A0ACB9EQA0_9ASTR|nr:hypothetical protein L1987_51537 [Smallanthus sonchifolius]
MVANVSSSATTPNPKLSSRGPSPSKPKRAPLVPSEADNNGPSLPRRPKSRDVSSRYLSSTASVTTTMTSTSSSSSFSSTTSSSSSNSMCTPRRRFPSPLVSSTNLMTPSSTMNSKRAQSTERRRPVTPRIGEMSDTAKMPARSLSASFQGQSLSKESKSPPTASNNGSRHGTPERRAVTPVKKLGNAKPIDQQRWPGRSRQESFMTRSVDFTNENMKLSGSGTVTAVRALQKSMIRETKLKPNKPETNRNADKLFSDSDHSDRAISDAESVSSGSTLGIIRGVIPGALMVPARFRQETVNRLRRIKLEPVSPPLSGNNKLASVNRYLKDGPALSPRGLSPSPVRRDSRPASPSKSVLLSSASSPSRGMPSPTRAWSRIGSDRRRKVGDNAIVDAHVLRLVHNKYLQWRFANARADAAMLVQRATAQKSLYNSWVSTSKIRQSVISKQIEVQQLRQNLKLYTVLKNQIQYLKVWDQVERDHIVSLSETIVSLESSTLRLPLVDGAKANLQSLKDAIHSAADVTQAMASVIRSIVIKAEYVNTLASELANTARNEHCMIDRCKELLSILTQMELLRVFKKDCIDMKLNETRCTTAA